MPDLAPRFANDAHFALRTLRKHPAFSTTVILALALGIGGTSAIFTLVDDILLRPLPFPQSDRLVQVMQTYPEIGLPTWNLSQGAVALYRDRSNSFDGFAAFAERPANLTGRDRPQRIGTALVTGQFFPVLGVHPALGRAIRPEEDVPHGPNVAVLSDGFWRQHFAGDPTIVGKTLQIDGAGVVVVGVMPPGFDYPSPSVQLWMPLGLDPSRIPHWFLRGVARLRRGVSPRAAQGETTQILWVAARQNPLFASGAVLREGLKLGTLVTPLKDAMTGAAARPLLVLQGAMVLILLIASANVATLLLGRASTRAREIALRHALGATPRRVMAQLLTESMVLAVAGAAMGTVLAWAVIATIGHLPVSGIPRIEHVAMDWSTLAFTIVLSLVTGLVFGVAPALQSTKLALSATLAEGGGARGTAHAAARRQHGALVIAQFAISLMLLIGSGLLIRSFRKMTAVDPGFRPEGVTAFTLPVPPMKYDNAQAARFHEAVVDSLRAIPGVTAAAIVSTLPFGGSLNSDGYIVEGHAPPSGTGAESQVYLAVVSPGYFNTLRIPLVRGRDFDGTDRAGAVPVAIVDETLARRFWPDGDALGKRIETTGDRVWLTIVGVVGGVHDHMLTDALTPHLYTPLEQDPTSLPFAVARASGDAGALTRAARRAISSLDPDLPVPDPHPLSYYIAGTLASQRLTNIVLTAFTALAVVLTSVGIYGVLALYVRRRSREFAIRLAIGAHPQQLLRSVLGQGLALAGTGAVVGVLGALAVTRYLRTMLYDVSPTDPLVFIALPLGLLGVATVACWLPAWRAGRSDPLVALRQE